VRRQVPSQAASRPPNHPTSAPTSLPNYLASLSAINPDLPWIFSAIRDDSKKWLMSRKRITSSIQTFGPPDFVLTIHQDSKSPWSPPRISAQDFISKHLPSVSNFIDSNKSGWSNSSSLLIYIQQDLDETDLGEHITLDMPNIPSTLAPLGAVLHLIKKDAEVRVRFTCPANATDEEITEVLFNDLGLERDLLVGPILRSPSAFRSDQHILVSFWSARPMVLAAYALSNDRIVESPVLNMCWSFIKLPGFLQHSCPSCQLPP